MKWKYLALMVFLIVALHGGAFAVDTEEASGNVIGGNLSGFLKADSSPYRVNETLVVPEGRVLLIEAGVELYFAEGTGLDVRGGSLAVMGELGNPVVFAAATEGGSWNGISVTGAKRSEVQGVVVKDAEFGFSVESGALELRDAEINNASRAALYVRNASVDIQWATILNSGNVGVWATQSASVMIDGTNFDNNHIALVVGDESKVSLQRSYLESNEAAILDIGNSYLKLRNTVLEGNQIGYASQDLPPEDVKKSMKSNHKDMIHDVEYLQNGIGDEPRNPYANGLKIGANLEVESVDSVWNVSGSVGVEVGYHKVLTRKHYESEPYVSGTDTVYTGDRYINYFQVPGLFTNWNADVLMQSPTGQVVEVVADVSNDSWDHFKVHRFQASYTDENQRLVLGDVYAHAGELYLAGVNAFGGSYDLKFLQNSVKDPLFEGSVFVGETKAPKIIGERNYDVYKDYVEDGEAEPQRMIVGGKVRWNMHRRFNGTLGFIGNEDYVEDPFLRDGMSEKVNMASPRISSKTFFADGNWLFFPGDIKLNGQVAVGGVDTVNVETMRAINQVFADAGLDASNYALLNRLMKDPRQVSALTAKQLESIYGDNSLKTPSEMRAELRSLLEKVSKIAKETVVDQAKPSKGDFWGHEHWAVAGSYQWSDDNTFIEGYLRYVGSEYFSAGSPDLLQNTRMIGGNLKRKIYDFWNLGFGYTVNVENAADDGSGYNIFGMAEGSKWGMFSGAESDWLEEHEQDETRAQYIHDAYLNNDFGLTDKLNLMLKYSINYRTRSTPQRLYANYSANSGIYNDPWFRAQRGCPTLKVYTEDDTLLIDSARWAKYYSVADEDYLATQFVERLMKHTLELGLTFKLPQKSVLKVGGAVEVRSDMSKFEQDDLLDQFDFNDETYGILGYYFHGGDYFEQRYPVSLTISSDGFRNMFAVMPRYKIYNRNEMREFEWTLSDNMDIDLSRNFLELSLGAGLRQNFLSYEIEEEDYDEMELDVDGSAKLRVYHTSSLYSDWTVGAIFNYRPDNRADQYKDFYMIAALNYEF
ncbi:right-handed parallel beta-helix repeat-containing protein [uncultured Fibrobacter sp.]|uniref:right-handed parallel beta-helix repeat-containing protein n=1 Tax=uncultured Fibrobacter sp. TaxID=261512 RepID=UPI0025D651F8|nr:right-handed parallel beta-helix repeat-containing protein [uncultured Fibrobacter sp.]